MKRIIQLALFFIVIITLIFFQKTYFEKNEKIVINSEIPNDQLTKQTENSLIKNLKYEVTLDQNNKYIITSDLSELNYIDNAELVKMQTVTAIFLDKNNVPLIIKSDNAVYNNSNYNTNFSNNVQIEYMNNKIFAEKLNLNLQNNMVKIFENVRYIGVQGTVKSDNIKINLITKKVDIYMDDESDNVELTNNQ